jgi:hypothetical protein
LEETVGIFAGVRIRREADTGGNGTLLSLEFQEQ